MVGDAKSPVMVYYSVFTQTRDTILFNGERIPTRLPLISQGFPKFWE
jgi:hypothetical protein